jgi:hypothetical protein
MLLLPSMRKQTVPVVLNKEISVTFLALEHGFTDPI